jgi:thioredoxin reductase (NADPH)
MIGAVPRTAWLHDVGVELDSRGFVTTRGTFATSIDGLFAVGDVRAGSVKRVASAVGEGSVVVSAVHSYLGALANTARKAELEIPGPGPKGSPATSGSDRHR